MTQASRRTSGDGARAHIEQIVRQVLADAEARGYPLPSAVRIDTDLFACYGRRAPRIPAQADPYAGEIYINPESFQFRSRKALRKYARRFHLKGYISTGDPAHVLRHELAHLLHADEAGIEFLEAHVDWPARDEGARHAAATVSLRAAEGPGEFVAEVFAGIWGLREFTRDAEVMRWYRRYRGPAVEVDGSTCEWVNGVHEPIGPLAR